MGYALSKVGMSQTKEGMEYQAWDVDLVLSKIIKAFEKKKSAQVKALFNSGGGRYEVMESVDESWYWETNQGLQQ